MVSAGATERHAVIVIGGGQAGLAMSQQLTVRGVEHVVLDAAARVGDAWRNRWSTLRVFTPARYDGLPGTPFPAPGHAFPTKDEVADYLEAYAAEWRLPVRSGVGVDALRAAADGAGFVVSAAGADLAAEQVVVATGAYHDPFVPPLASELDPTIRQLHSSQFRSASQLQPGGVLVVGASNSGGEIAFDVARTHETWLAGRDTGQMPFDIDGRVARVADRIIWFMANHVLTVRTPMGRAMRSQVRQHGTPLERVRKAELAAAGVHREYVRMSGVRGGKPQLDDGRVLDVRNVIWCTGFRRDYGWVELPLLGDDGWPAQEHGVVSGVPGLYIIGLPFLDTFASGLIGGVGRDAAYLAPRIAARVAAQVPKTGEVPQAVS